MFHSKYQLKPITNKVFYYPNAFFHKDLIKYVYELGNDNEIPNLLFYGGDGCGKHSLVNLLLYYLFGEDIYHTYVETYGVNTNNNTVKMINIKQSNHHMIFYPHKNAFDKYIIQHIVKTFIQSNSFNYEYEKNKFKVVVINNVESLNYLTQMSLRRTMEEYNSNCRFVFICNSINNIIDPLKSRCVSHRVPNPNNDELEKLALHIALKEGIKFKIGDIKDIVIKSEHNVKKMLLMLDLYSIGANINDIYDNNIDIIIKYIRTKKILFVNNIKDKIYDLIITNISPSKIMYDIMKKLLSDDMDINDKIIKCSIKHNKLLSNSRRDIIVLNSYVINLMFCL